MGRLKVKGKYLYEDNKPFFWLGDTAWELFTKLNATARSLRQDYENAYGPLRAANSPCDTPFAWNDNCYAWPWAKEGEV